MGERPESEDRRGLFASLPRDRAPVKRMHVIDAGQGCISFRCRHCGYESGWIVDERTVTENRRGLPCPKCNAAPTDEPRE